MVSKSVIDFSESTRHVGFTRHLEDSSGGGFHEQGDTLEKQHQRKIVISHFLEHKPKDLNMVSLPGSSWNVENALFSELNNACVFVGVERDTSTFIRSQRYMPEYVSRLKHRKRRSWKCVDGTTMDSVDAGKSKIVHGDLSEIINRSGTREIWVDGKKQKFPLLRHFNAFWLDHFGPLGSTNVLDSVVAMMRKSTPISAFAITFMVGRDTTDLAKVFSVCPGESHIEKRAAFIELLGKRNGALVKITGTHRHPSWNKDGNVQMGTVFGTIKKEQVK